MQPDNSKRFLNMSGGVLAITIALVILVPILCCAGCFIFGGISTIVNPPEVNSSYTP